MGQKNSIQPAIDCETIIVWTNTYCQNSLPGQIKSHAKNCANPL